MRLLYAITTVAMLAACTATAPETDVTLKTEASSDCIDNQDWAFSANRGSYVYAENCDYCHQSRGTGKAGKVPALAGNQAVLADPKRGIRLILTTGSDADGIHGMKLDNMVALFGDLTPTDIADVLTYVRSSWNNCAPAVTEAQVRAVADSI